MSTRGTAEFDSWRGPASAHRPGPGVGLRDLGLLEWGYKWGWGRAGERREMRRAGIRAEGRGQKGAVRPGRLDSRLLPRGPLCVRPGFQVRVAGMWGEVGGGVPATRLPSLSERPHGSPLSHTRVQSGPRSVMKCTFAPRSNLERESLARRRLRSSVVAWNLNWDPKTCTGNR